MKRIISNILLKVGTIVTLTSTLSALTFNTSVTDRYNFIYAYGKIIHGDVYRLSRIYKKLSKNKQTIIVFNSGGGELRAGIKLGIYIKKNRIATAVSRNGICASSCALAFLGGRDIYNRAMMILPTRSKLGFHSFYYKNSKYVSSEKVLQDFSYLIKYFHYVNAPEYLLTKMLDTNSNNMYWITQRNNRFLPLKRGLKLSYASLSNKKIDRYKHKNIYNSKVEAIKNYFGTINLAIKANSGYSSRYVALNSTAYNNWLSRNLKYIYIKKIKLLKHNRAKVSVIYMLNNYQRICTNNTYRLKRIKGGWSIASKQINLCSKRYNISKSFLNKLP